MKPPAIPPDHRTTRPQPRLARSDHDPLGSLGGALRVITITKSKICFIFHFEFFVERIFPGCGRAGRRGRKSEAKPYSRALPLPSSLSGGWNASCRQCSPNHPAALIHGLFGLAPPSTLVTPLRRCAVTLRAALCFCLYDVVSLAPSK